MAKGSKLSDRQYTTGVFIGSGILVILLALTYLVDLWVAPGVPGEQAAPIVRPSEKRAIAEDELKEQVAEFTDDVLVGQLLMFGFRGRGLAAVEEMVSEFSLGNVMLLSEDYETPEQMHALTNGIQQAARDADLPGMLVAVDQEGGRVNRIKGGGVVTFPSQKRVYEEHTPEEAAAIARATAQQLKALGINTVLAPVLDVNIEAESYINQLERSFSEKPARVGIYAAAYINSFRQVGIASCAKHFPMYTMETGDPHALEHDMPMSLQNLDRNQFIPYRMAFDAQVPMVMTAHVTMSEVLSDDPLPVTIDKRAVDGLLRDHLHFRGVVITDDMNMAALTAFAGDGSTLAVEALEAGVDIILMADDPERQRQAVAEIRAALAEGRLTRTRLEESVVRIMRLKRDYGVAEPLILATDSLEMIDPELYSDLPVQSPE